MKKKKKTGFGFSFADPFKKMRMLQGTPKKKKKSSPFISHSASKFLQTTKIISTNPKSAILYYSIIHQKEKSFVNQVSCKFKYMLFTKKKPNLFRKKKNPISPPPSSLTCNCLVASTTHRFATPNHGLSLSLTEL